MCGGESRTGIRDRTPDTSGMRRDAFYFSRGRVETAHESVHVSRRRGSGVELVAGGEDAVRCAGSNGSSDTGTCGSGFAGRDRLPVDRSEKLRKSDCCTIDLLRDFRFQISDLKGILIKNPVNADAALWIGNIERLEKTGVPVIAVHRGCNHRPCWSMAHTVRNARPDIPMLLDPSHMSGKAAKVPELMEKIETLALDGAMVEVHVHPEAALSDRKQQIRPDEISDFRFQISDFRGQNSEFRGQRSEFRVQNSEFRGQSSELELNWLRAEIDELDEQIWDSIAARMDVSKRIGEWKKEHGIAPLQPERYKEIVKELKIKNEKLRMNGLPLSEQFMLNIWEMIHEESLRQQR